MRVLGFEPVAERLVGPSEFELTESGTLGEQVPAFLRCQPRIEVLDGVEPQDGAPLVLNALHRPEQLRAQVSRVSAFGLDHFLPPNQEGLDLIVSDRVGHHHRRTGVEDLVAVGDHPQSAGPVEKICCGMDQVLPGRTVQPVLHIQR